MAAQALAGFRKKRHENQLEKKFVFLQQIFMPAFDFFVHFTMSFLTFGPFPLDLSSSPVLKYVKL